MNNPSNVPPAKRLFSASATGLERKMLLGPEPKSVEWVMDLVNEFCKAEEIVLDTGASISATAKACLKLPEHHRFVGFKKDSASFQDALP